MSSDLHTREQELAICRMTAETYEAMERQTDALRYAKQRSELQEAFHREVVQSINDTYLRLNEAAAVRGRIESELRIAHDMQMSMVPPLVPPFTGRREFDLHAVLLPAREVGGDLYDMFFLDNDRLCLVIGDVSDKGVPASLLMAMTHTLIRALAFTGAPPDAVLRDANVELARNNPSFMFVTAFLCLLDLRTGLASWANAGHCRPIILRRGAPPVHEPIPLGLPLGLEPVAAVEAGTLQLAPADMLFLYTDGVTEAFDKEGTMYTDERLLAVLAAHPQAGAKEMIGCMLEALKLFSAGAPQSDDITMLALRYRPE